MGVKVLLMIVLTVGLFSDGSATFMHRRRFNTFGYRSPPMQPLFPIFPKFYMNPHLSKPPPPVPAPVPEIDRIVKFHLYTRTNKYVPEDMNIDFKRTRPNSNFKVNKKTKILIHGFVDSATDSSSGEWMNYMRDAYLDAEDVNVIVVDYSFIALLIFYWTNLPQMSAMRIAELVYFLNNNGSPYDSVHLVGRSWGAHVAGMAGHTLNGKLGRITGLDPVQPPFRFIGFQYRLDKTDAKFVDVYHLNGRSKFNLLDVLGVSHRYDGLSPPMGHIDVYPNFRLRQETGCPIQQAGFYTPSCRLGMGARIFTETIKRANSFTICPCENFFKYLRGDCRCDARNTVNMGEHISQEVTGVYQISDKPSIFPIKPVTAPPSTTTNAPASSAQPDMAASQFPVLVPSSTAVPAVEDVVPETASEVSSLSSTAEPASPVSEPVPMSSTSEPPVAVSEMTSGAPPASVSMETSVSENTPESSVSPPSESSTVVGGSISEAPAVSSEPNASESTSEVPAVSIEPNASESTSEVPASVSSQSPVSSEGTSESAGSSSVTPSNESNLIPDAMPAEETSSTTATSVPPSNESNMIPDNVPSEESSPTSSTSTLAPASVVSEGVSPSESVSTTTTTAMPTTQGVDESSSLPDRQTGAVLSEDGQSVSSNALGRRQPVLA